MNIPEHLKLRLRWRFIFSNGKADKVGVWNAASNHICDQAWAVDKKFLIAVIIEAETKDSRLIKLLEVGGQIYASMEWVATANVPVFLQNSGSPRTNIVGISVLTDKEKITCYIDGSIASRKLDEYETKFKIKEHTL